MLRGEALEEHQQEPGKMPTGLGGPMVVLVNRSLVKPNVKFIVHRGPLSRHMYLELALDVKEGMSRGLSKSDDFL